MKSKVAGLWAKLGTFLGALVGILLVTGIAYGVGNQVFNAGSGIEITTDTASDLNISTQATTGGGVSIGSRSNTTAIYVNTSNNVGIGTTGPGYPLQVNGAISLGSSNLNALTPRFITYDDGWNTSYTTYGVDAVTRHKYTGPIYWMTVPTGATRLSDNGTITMVLSGNNVGIGISPSYKLDVSGAGNFTGTVIVGTPTAGGHAATKSYVDTVAAGGTLLSRSGTDTYVTNTGDEFGIGTTGPLAKLHVSGDNAEIRLSGGTYNSIRMYDAGTGDPGYTQCLYNGSVDANVGANGTYFAALGGNVGIGTASPGAKLDVAGQVYSTGYVNRDNTPYGFVGTNVYADTINTGAASDPLELNYYRAGDIRFTGGDMTMASGRYIYPGRTDAGDYQKSWYLASNASWGLQTNTSFRAVGGLYADPEVRANASGGNGYLALCASNGCLTGYPSTGYPTLKTNGTYIYFDIGGVYAGYANSSREIYFSNFRDYDSGSFYVDPNGTSYVNDFRASIVYDRDNTGYYSDPASTSRMGTVNADLLRSYGNVYIDNNYGLGIVGVYASTRYQGVFAMGDAYKLPADGTTTGSLYGLAWSHPNAGGVAANLNTHGLLVMENGAFLAAVSGSIRARDDMRAPLFYDSNNTGYYIDPASTSVTNDMRANIFYDQGNTGYYMDPNSNSNISALQVGGYNLLNWPGYQAGFVQNAGAYMYPGRVDGGSWQTSWYLGSHASYGLYTNTGMYIASGLTVGGGINMSGRLYVRADDSGTSPGMPWFRGNGGYIVLNSLDGYYVYLSWDAGAGVQVNDPVWATAFYYQSDIRLKTDLKPIAGLEMIKNIGGYTFKWRETGEEGAGLIAQEVEKVLPVAVTVNAKGMKTVDSAALMAPMVESIKQLDAKVEAQQAVIDRLEAEIKELKK